MPIRPGGAALTIGAGIREWAVATPTATAVIDGDRRLTYAALDERANRLANALLGLGLGAGAPVAVLLGNRLEYPEVAAGIARAGAVMVPLNPRLSEPEARYILEHSKARALLLDDALAAVAGDAVDALGMVCLGIDGEQLGPSYEAALADAPARDPGIAVDELDPYCIAYTSGTTGRPKGVLISHRSRTLTFSFSAFEWGLGLGRTTIAVAPMYHGAGFAFGYAPVVTGGAVTMLRAWDPEWMLELVQRDRVQSMFLVPAHAAMLRAMGEDVLSAYDLSCLDTLYFNAAPFPGPLKTWVLDTFPSVGVHEVYGSTEGGVVTNCRPPDARRKLGSVGRAWFHTELKIVRDDGSPVDPGEPGELFSRSPYVMTGYLDDPEATAACSTDDGYVSAGDVVVVDDEGFVTIVDRKKDLIISGGFNVYPREVEEAVATHPAVHEVAVVGHAHDVWGEQVVAYAVLVPGAELGLEQLDEHVRPRLAGYKVPRELHVVDALPRSAAGKVLKRELTPS